MAGAALRDILGDSRSAKCCILHYKIVSKIGPGRSPKRRVRDDDFMVGLWSECGRNVFESFFYWRKHFREVPQAQYLVRLEGDFTCSTHWK